jgi:hypothetical protein
MLEETFQVARGVLIHGKRSVGKTLLELNLREAILGTYRCEKTFTENNGVCFIGRTVRADGRERILATAGSETIRWLLREEELPPADWYIGTVTPNYDYCELLKLFRKRLTDVLVINLWTMFRQQYFEARTKMYSHRMPRSHLGPARPCIIDGLNSWPILTITSENLHVAYKIVLERLNILYYITRRFDYDLLSRSVLQSGTIFDRP